MASAWTGICGRWTKTPKSRTGIISADCPVGDYTLQATISSDEGVAAGDLAAFSVAAPASDDATLSSLALSGIDIGGFNSAATGYTASVGNDVTETTVAATANDDGATYVVKLGGAADSDGTVSLAVGDNVITIEVTVEDGETTKTYTVTVARAEAEEEGDSGSSADDEPSAAVSLSPAQPVKPGTEISVTMSFASLDTDTDTSTTDYTFRADVKDLDGNDADACEGDGLGVERYMYKVDEDPETRAGIVSGDCPAGAYVVVASIARDGSQAAQAQAEFDVLPVLVLLAFPHPIT